MDSDFDWSDFDWSEFNARYLGLTFDSQSSLFLSSFNNGRHLLTREVHRSLPRHNAPRFPVEIFSEIFLYMVQADPRSRTELMLVCRHWYDIMLSTPGIHSQLRIHCSTEKRVVERFGNRWLIDVTVDSDYVTHLMYKADLNFANFQATFTAAAETASRWRSLAFLSLPPPEKCEDLQIMHPLQRLESFKLAASCNLGNFLEPLLAAITTTVTPRFTVMEIFNPDAALHLLRPSHFQIFSSLTTLRLVCRKMQNPVDILPSLPKLEILDAQHLFLPMYQPGIDLPLTQTLRVLHLKSVSIQWMAGQIFLALNECSIIFPLHSDAIHSVDMPSCLILKYDSNNLSALEHFHISTLDKLEINCGQWRTWSGDVQLIHLHPIFAAQSLTCLHMEIKCSGRLLAYMLRLVPALEELWMGLSSPHALSTAFFPALAAGGHKTNACPSTQTIVPLGRKLRKLHLHYKRWLRGPEKIALIPAFGAIMASRARSLKGQHFSFRLSFGEESKLQEWDIHGPIKKFGCEPAFDETLIGVSSPYGIIPLTRVFGGDGDGDYFGESGCLPLLREPEYITTRRGFELPIESLLSFHSLKEVRNATLSLKKKPDTQFSLDAPIFHTLKVLNVVSIPSTFLAGQTFHRLERYKEQRIDDVVIPGLNPLTEMPVCTRLVAPLLRLATLKLPQIRELSLSQNGASPDRLWEEHVKVNANLSGLKLLHLRGDYITWPPIAVIKILESLPALETLIIDYRPHIFPSLDVFEAFVPLNVPGPSALNQSSWEGQISGVLCPRLESLQIQGIRLTGTGRADLMPVLKDIVTLRAITGSPLKSFTFFCDQHLMGRQKWQLIGGDKSFVMQEVVPARFFELEI